MQIIEVNLIDGYPFYCPVTGEQILTEDDFNPSPAMVYCYVQDESMFEFINEKAKQAFGGGDQLKKDNCLEYENYDKLLQSLIDDSSTSSWVCFRLCSGRNFSSYVVDHCIDMSYRNEDA
jgi:hypothetical protein